jgi:hypothetical protein
MIGSILISAATLLAQPDLQSLELRVDPSVSGEGLFATLEAARDHIRTLKERGELPVERITVTITDGVYYRDEPFTLDAADRGDPVPIVYRAEPGATVRITGGVVLTDFMPVESDAVRERLGEHADHVVQCDLRAAGIDDFGELRPRGFGQGGEAALELFFDDKPMTLAEWPNGDWSTIADTPAGSDGGLFTYEGDRPARWVDEPDAWLHGYWTWDWADSYVPVASIDVESKTIHTAEPHGVYGYKKGQRFRALNVLAELDAPGEWYVDRESGMLYFWPPGPLEGARVEVSVGRSLIQVTGASGIAFEGLILDQCRATAVRIEGGSGIEFRGCTIRNIGSAGISISGGTKHRVQSCDIFETGDGGVSISGGDRITLTPGEHEVVNNHIYRYSRWCRTYRPAVMVSGVGNRIAHNRIHDAPHNGIQLGGNEHIIEYNELFDICKETGDVGAFYMGRDWTTRGNIIRFNYFHDIEGPYTHGAMAVYLDDCASGATIHGNLFYKASRAAFIGGGRDNTVTNNVFVDCHPAVHIDSRALGWAKEYAVPGGGWHMFEKLDAVDHDAPPYSERYPKLATILDEAPPEPRGNVVARNIAFESKWMDLPGTDPELVEQTDNWTEGDPGFVDIENGDFRIREDSPVWDLGFEALPLEKMGLQLDEYRTSLPE